LNEIGNEPVIESIEIRENNRVQGATRLRHGPGLRWFQVACNEHKDVVQLRLDEEVEDMPVASSFQEWLLFLLLLPLALAVGPQSFHRRREKKTVTTGTDTEDVY
jgi:hypothetical protein